MVAELNAASARAQDEDFIRQCCLESLQARLPLLWPTPPDTPPSPKKQYRSHYRYRGWHDLLEPAVWHYLSEFDLLLRLIDFSGLRPVLAQRLGWTSAQGQIPFDVACLFANETYFFTTLKGILHSLRSFRMTFKDESYSV